MITWIKLLKRAVARESNIGDQGHVYEWPLVMTNLLYVLKTTDGSEQIYCTTVVFFLWSGEKRGNPRDR